MLGLIAARTYHANEIITVYTGDDIGAVEGALDAYKGYHRIEAMARGDGMNKGRHVMEVLKYITEDDENKGEGPRRMWRRLIDGYNGYTHAQYMNAAYKAPKGYYDKARLCEGGTIRVKKGCVIHEGEEVLFMYGKAYWDRWGNDDELKSTQAKRRGEGETQGAEMEAGEGDCVGEHEAGSSTTHGAEGEGDGEAGMADEGSERVVRREEGVRVEEWSERRRGKRRMDMAVVAPNVDASSRKMPKGGKKVQWTAVAWDAYVL